jgi:AcrR family transcriptional regulator
MPKVTEAHRAARRRQVLDAAGACFARQGFHRTTMRDIVSEARLSPGAVYGYFSSKADIIEAIAAERHSHERALIRHARAHPEAAEVLRQLARDFLGALTKPEERSRRRVGVQLWAEALRDRRVLKLVRRGIDEPPSAWRRSTPAWAIATWAVRSPSSWRSGSSPSPRSTC